MTAPQRPERPQRHDPGSSGSSGSSGSRSEAGAGRQVDSAWWLPAEPFAHFEDIYRRMQHMMRNLAIEPVHANEPGQTGQTGQHTGSDRGAGSPMAVDLEETEDTYILDIDLPGVTPADLVVEWGERHLLLHGQVQARPHTGEPRQQTRATGKFDHTIALPGPIDGPRITATLTHGVLTVHAPKTTTTTHTSRRVPINIASPRTASPGSPGTASPGSASPPTADPPTDYRPHHAGTTTTPTG
jgi:HSP20 family protein